MIKRRAKTKVVEALKRQAAVGLIGPRQTGKTTLALEIADESNALYLDLESSAERAKLADPELFLSNFSDKLVILDEVHRVPELFQTLKVLIDRGRRQGQRYGRFLVLGSASIDLLRQSGESLAGRIEYIDMGPIDILEVGTGQRAQNQLWIRGGFPDSYLASSDTASLMLRRSFIRTYLERDVAQFGPRIAAETLERLWTMLAHNQGAQLNNSKLASALSVSATTVSSYVDLLCDLLLLRRLRPYSTNLGKRLVKAPRVYIRDSGLLHALLGLTDLNHVCGHPQVGASWEGFVIENLLACAPEYSQASYFRTSAGAEIDLLLELGVHGLWAIEIKRGLNTRPDKGFHLACADLKPTRRFLVYPGEETYQLPGEITVTGLHELALSLANLDLQQ